MLMISSMAEACEIRAALAYGGAAALRLVQDAAHDVLFDREHAAFIAGREPGERRLRCEYRFAFRERVYDLDLQPRSEDGRESRLGAAVDLVHVLHETQNRDIGMAGCLWAPRPPPAKLCSALNGGFFEGGACVSS